MKNFVLFLFLLGAAFAVSFTAARWVNTDLLSHSEPITPLAEVPSLPPTFTLKNLPFTVVIVGINNGATVAKTLSSVFSQNYDNYRVVYIDDASDDGSFDLARDLIYDSEHLGQVTYVHNTERLGVLANLVRAIQTSADREIIVVLQGEDWLAHEWVLQRLNAYYANPDLWMTYGQYRDFPTYQLGICRALREEFGVRSQPFVASHLKTFYAGLFKKIREADFIYGGKFLPASSDFAYMLPMLEMAKEHAHFIPEILYINNRQTNFKEERELQMRCEKWVRALDSYPPLTTLHVPEVP